MALEPGQTISHYRLVEKIGEGGMGVVWMAEDPRLRRRVALKVLPPELVADPERRRRLVHEARAEAAINHPNIATVHEVDEAEGVVFVAMEYVEGKSLRNLLKQGPMPIAEASRLATAVAEGLAAAHAARIVHRDLKPENVMVRPDGHVKVLDFGLAKVLQEQEDLSRSKLSKVETLTDELTRQGRVLGTASYMSPEQALGRKVDLRTDIWSFGCMLHEMLAGRAPFQGESKMAVVAAILHNEPEPIAALRSGLPAGLMEIVARCLDKDPQRRYTDADSLLGALKTVRSQLTAGRIAPARNAPPSVAVLPFVDMSPAKDHEYFGDGIAEELINTLVRVQDLRVVARTSAFAFKGANVDVREMGRKLNVDTVLEGSIRVFGNRLRITAQLISVEDGFHLWSERFDRELTDVFAIQDEISLALVAKLKGKLLIGEVAAVRKRATENHEAYTLYLKGLHFAYDPNPESLDRALRFFRDAAAKDADFALAHAGMATVHSYRGILSLAHPAEMLRMARVSLQRALELDPELAEAHLGSASLAFWLEWDWDEGDRSMERALALNPGNAEAYGIRAWRRLQQRRFDDAIRDIEHAMSLDPLKPLLYAWSVGLRAAAGRMDEALAEFNKAMEMEPGLGLAYFHAGIAYIRKGLFDEAIQIVEQGKDLIASPGWAECLLGLASLKRGDRKRTSRILQEVIEAKKTGSVSATAIAFLAAGLERYDEAFSYLDQAYRDRDGVMVQIDIYTEIFCPQMRSDPRYEVMLRRMKLAK
jgi:serine/threonine protein kinase/tetratricopeptide (TPR) repeat protein